MKSSILTESSPRIPLPVAVGERFDGKYIIRGVLGSGGMGVVLEALHEALGKTVAIKMLAVSEDQRLEGAIRLTREARAVACLKSEHIARVDDVDVDASGQHYVVMEHLVGADLHAVLRRGEPLPVETCVGYILHACEGIAEAHALGIVHRDLKPENLFLTERPDGSPLVKVLDFGVSKLSESRGGLGRSAIDDATIDIESSLLGSPHYMPPEQARTPGEIDARVDVWALGVILFELLTRQQPFKGATVQDILLSVLTQEPPSPRALRPELPEALAGVVLACLAKDRDARTPSVARLALQLRPWAPAWAMAAANQAARAGGVDPAGTPPKAPPALAMGTPPPAGEDELPRMTQQVAPPTRRRRFLVTGIGALALLAVVAGVRLFSGGGRPGAASARLDDAPIDPWRGGPPSGSPSSTPEPLMAGERQDCPPPGASGVTISVLEAAGPTAAPGGSAAPSARRRSRAAGSLRSEPAPAKSVLPPSRSKRGRLRGALARKADRPIRVDSLADRL